MINNSPANTNPDGSKNEVTNGFANTAKGNDQGRKCLKKDTALDSSSWSGNRKLVHGGRTAELPFAGILLPPLPRPSPESRVKRCHLCHSCERMVRRGETLKRRQMKREGDN